MSLVYMCPSTYKLYPPPRILGKATGQIVRITNIKRLEGGAEVVALRSKSGWYKTAVGISHNCDDM